jgi:hypothetical protein
MKMALSVIVWLCTTGVAMAQATPRSFIHPGVLTSQAELEVIQKRIAAADPRETTYTGYLSTMKSRFADLNYQPLPAPRIKRGDHKPQDGPSRMRDSAISIAFSIRPGYSRHGVRQGN